MQFQFLTIMLLNMLFGIPATGEPIIPRALVNLGVTQRASESIGIVARSSESIGVVARASESIDIVTRASESIGIVARQSESIGIVPRSTGIAACVILLPRLLQTYHLYEATETDNEFYKFLVGKPRRSSIHAFFCISKYIRFAIWWMKFVEVKIWTEMEIGWLDLGLLI